MVKSVYSKPYRNLVKFLRNSREAAGITQTKLSALIGRPQSFVSKYESFDRRLDTNEFLTIAKKIGVPEEKVVEIVVGIFRAH